MTLRQEINLALTFLMMFIELTFCGLLFAWPLNEVEVGSWLFKAAIACAIGWFYLVHDIENNHKGES